jgi:hypothetical protein
MKILYGGLICILIFSIFVIIKFYIEENNIKHKLTYKSCTNIKNPIGHCNDINSGDCIDTLKKNNIIS